MASGNMRHLFWQEQPLEEISLMGAPNYDLAAGRDANSPSFQGQPGYVDGIARRE